MLSVERTTSEPVRVKNNTHQNTSALALRRARRRLVNHVILNDPHMDMLRRQNRRRLRRFAPLHDQNAAELDFDYDTEGSPDLYNEQLHPTLDIPYSEPMKHSFSHRSPRLRPNHYIRSPSRRVEPSRSPGLRYNDHVGSLSQAAEVSDCDESRRHRPSPFPSSRRARPVPYGTENGAGPWSTSKPSHGTYEGLWDRRSNPPTHRPRWMQYLSEAQAIGENDIPLVERAMEDVQNKARHYFVLFERERKRREKLEQTAYWYEQSNGVLWRQLQHETQKAQALLEKVSSLRGNPAMMKTIIERVDLLYLQLDTLVQSLAGVSCHMAYKDQSKDEALTTVLDYLFPCRGLDPRLNALYGATYYYKLGLVSDKGAAPVPPAVPDYSPRGAPRTAWLPSGIKPGPVDPAKFPTSPKGAAKTPSTVQAKQPAKAGAEKKTAIVRLTPDPAVQLEGYQAALGSVTLSPPTQADEVLCVFRYDNEPSATARAIPERVFRSTQVINGVAKVNELLLVKDLPPKVPGVLPSFCIDFWSTSNTQKPLGTAQRSFVDPEILVLNNSWPIRDSTKKQIGTVTVSIGPHPQNAMLPALRYQEAQHAATRKGEPLKQTPQEPAQKLQISKEREKTASQKEQSPKVLLGPSKKTEATKPATLGPPKAKIDVLKKELDVKPVLIVKKTQPEVTEGKPTGPPKAPKQPAPEIKKPAGAQEAMKLGLPGMKKPTTADIKQPGSPIMKKPGPPEMKKPEPPDKTKQPPGAPEVKKPKPPEMEKKGALEAKTPKALKTKTTAAAEIKKPGVIDIKKPGAPLTAKPGEPLQIKKPGQPEIKKPGLPATKKPGQPEIKKPGLPVTKKLGQPEIKKPGLPEMKKPGLPETKKPGLPEMKEPASIKAKKPGQLDIKKPIAGKLGAADVKKPALVGVKKPTVDTVKKLDASAAKKIQRTPTADSKKPPLPSDVVAKKGPIKESKKILPKKSTTTSELHEKAAKPKRVDSKKPMQAAPPPTKGQLIRTPTTLSSKSTVATKGAEKKAAKKEEKPTSTKGVRKGNIFQNILGRRDSKKPASKLQQSKPASKLQQSKGSVTKITATKTDVGAKSKQALAPVGAKTKKSGPSKVGAKKGLKKSAVPKL